MKIKKYIWIGLTWIQIIKLYVIAVEFVNDLITHNFNESVREFN